MRAILLLSLAACGPAITTTTVTTVQSVCVDGDEIVATMAGCLSSSCDTLVDTTCSVSRSEGVITLTPSATVESQGDECTADCGIIEVRCSLPADAAQGDILQSGGDDGGPTIGDAACDAT